MLLAHPHLEKREAKKRKETSELLTITENQQMFSCYLSVLNATGIVILQESLKRFTEQKNACAKTTIVVLFLE